MTTEQKSRAWILLGIVVVVLAMGFTALGYFVGSGFNINVSTNTEHSNHPEPSFSESNNNNQSVPSYTLTEFEDPTRFDSLLERTNALYNMIANVDFENLRDFWTQSQSLTVSNIRDEIQSVIIQRWSVLDPIAALEIVESEAPNAHQHSLFDSVFREWSFAELEDVVKHIRKFDQDSKTRAISSIVRAREDLSYNKRREIARQLDSEWIAIDVLKQSTNTSVIDTPAQEWRSFVWENKNDLMTLRDAQNHLMSRIAFSWIVQDGTTAFEKMRHSLPAEVSLLETARFVSSELVESNPELGFDLLLAGTRQETESAYLEQALHHIAEWARTDPRTAFAATDAVVAPTLQFKLRNRVLWVWAQNNPESLLNNIEQLPQSLKLKARKTAFTYIAKQSPERVRAMLDGITERKFRNVIAETVVRSWALTDLASTLQWIESDTNLTHIQDDLTLSAYYSLAQVNPKLAVQTAVTQPLRESNEGWESLVVIWTAKDNLDVATDLLPLVRPGRTRSRAYDAVVEYSIEEQDWERAIDLIVQYDDKKGNTLGSSVKTIAQEAPMRLYERLETIDSPWLRQSVALYLVANNKTNSVFTDQQLELLEEISQAPTPQRPQQKPSTRLQEAFDNFNRVYEEEQSD